MSDVPVTELAHFLCAYDRTFPNAGAGANLLAVPTIGNVDDGDVEHRRVAEQIFFALARIDGLCTSDDHVLYAPDDTAVARQIERGQVAGMQSPGRVEYFAGALGVAPIPQQHAIATRTQLAGHGGRHVGITGPVGLPRKPRNLGHQISGDCGHLTDDASPGAVHRLARWRHMATRSRTMLFFAD